MSNSLISLKRHNYDYAPGIATYGIDGQKGDAGDSGNNIYYTSFIITNKTDLASIKNQIKNNLLPLKNSTVSNERGYQNNDMFFDINGVVWQLYDYDLLISSQTTASYEDFFKVVGNIKLDKNEYVDVDGNTGRVILNTSDYNGFDIIMGDVDSQQYANTDSPINIVSNITDDNNNIQLMQFQAAGIGNEGQLKVYYDTNTKAFHLYSDSNIMIDSSVYIKDNNDLNMPKYDDYSPVITSQDSITYFHQLCDQLAYNISVDSSNVDCSINITVKDYNLSTNEQLDILNRLATYADSLYLKLYDSSNNQAIIPFNVSLPMVNAKNSPVSIVNLGFLDTSSNGQKMLDISIYEYPYNGNVISTINNIYYNHLYYVSDKQYESYLHGFPADGFNVSLFNIKYQLGQYGKYYDQTQTLVNTSVFMPIKQQQFFIDSSASYSNVFEFTTPKSGDFIIKETFDYNYLNKTNMDIIDISIADNTYLENDKTYYIYFDYTTEIKPNGLICLTCSNKVLSYQKFVTSKQYDNVIPAFSFPLPSGMSSISKVSMLHNTEIFIENQSYI